MELSTDYQKFGLKIKHRLSTDYQKSENSQLVTFLLRCLYTILSVLLSRFFSDDVSTPQINKGRDYSNLTSPDFCKYLLHE